MEHALVILCGGNSTRMGTDKALLPFGESCLIEYIIEKYRPYFTGIYLSVKRKGAYAHLHLPVTEIADIYPNAGPMSGIFSGLAMMDEDAAFFMSVDTPFLEPELGLQLLEDIGDSDICMIDGRTGSMEAYMAAYSKTCTAAVGRCLLLHQLTFETLQEKCRTTYLPEELLAAQTASPMELQFFHMNTREDYYKALHRLDCI